MWSGHNRCGMRSCGLSGWRIGQLPLQALYQGPAAPRSCGSHPDHCPEPRSCVICSDLCLSSSASTANVNTLTLPTVCFCSALTCHHEPSQGLPGGTSWLPVLSSGSITMVLMCGATLKQWIAQVHFLLIRKSFFFFLFGDSCFLHFL